MIGQPKGRTIASNGLPSYPGGPLPPREPGGPGGPRGPKLTRLPNHTSIPHLFPFLQAVPVV